MMNVFFFLKHLILGIIAIPYIQPTPATYIK